jgi:hypothetical protein
VPNGYDRLQAGFGQGLAGVGRLGGRNGQVPTVTEDLEKEVPGQVDAR